MVSSFQSSKSSSKKESDWFSFDGMYSNFVAPSLPGILEMYVFCVIGVDGWCDVHKLVQRIVGTGSLSVEIYCRIGPIKTLFVTKPTSSSHRCSLFVSRSTFSQCLFSLLPMIKNKPSCLH